MPGNNYPKLHNAMWPGLVGKGPDSEPPIDLDTMLKLTAAARFDGGKFEGVDLFLADPHTSINSSKDDIQRLGRQDRRLRACGWLSGRARLAASRRRFRDGFGGRARQICLYGRESLSHCAATERHRNSQVWSRPDRFRRRVHDWASNPAENQKQIAKTFGKACDVAEQYGERLAAEGEICWGGMHSWKDMVDLLEAVGRPKTLGFQADMAHTLLYTMGYNAPEHRILPKDYDWADPKALDEAIKKLAHALRPWTIDFHVAQNDATVKGEGSHDKTGRHCMVGDPNGKLDITRHAGYWLRDDKGELTKVCKHICWDGCMFPNSEMMKQKTWDDILGAMVKVRDAHGWAQ